MLHAGSWSWHARFFRKNSSASLLLYKKCFLSFEEVMRHADWFLPHNSDTFISSETNQIPIFFLWKKMLIFYEEMMRHAGSCLIDQCLIISSEKNAFFVWRSNEARRPLSEQWAPHYFLRKKIKCFFSEVIKRLANFPPNNKCLIISSEKKAYFFLNK